MPTPITTLVYALAYNYKHDFIRMFIKDGNHSTKVWNCFNPPRFVAPIICDEEFYILRNIASLVYDCKHDLGWELIDLEYGGGSQVSPYSQS